MPFELLNVLMSQQKVRRDGLVPLVEIKKPVGMIGSPDAAVEGRVNVKMMVLLGELFFSYLVCILESSLATTMMNRCNSIAKA